MGADKSLAGSGRKQGNVSVRMAWISFGSLPCREKNLMTARVSMLLKSRASLTCFRACFLPGRAKDLSAPRYYGTVYRFKSWTQPRWSKSSQSFKRTIKNINKWTQEIYKNQERNKEPPHSTPFQYCGQQFHQRIKRTKFSPQLPSNYVKELSNKGKQLCWGIPSWTQLYCQTYKNISTTCFGPYGHLQVGHEIRRKKNTDRFTRTG